MKKLIFLSLFILPSFLFAQVDAGQDITICDSEDVVLSATYIPISSAGTDTYSIESIPLSMDPIATGTNLNTLADDVYSDIIDIGFEFCFYGNTFNQLLISTNNYISFDLTNVGLFSPWNTYSFPSEFPPGQVTNSILGPWLDLNPNNGGNLFYNVYGVAPFRRFVASFEDFGYYVCGGSKYNGQIKIFESTNVIEIHIQDQPLCSSWNNGQSILGIVNEDESQFLIQEGWNNTQMTGNNQAFRFVPNEGINLTWTDELGNAIGNGNQVTVSPTSTTTYTVTAYECLNNLTDEVTITFSPPINIQVDVDDILCPGEFFGGIDITANGGTGNLYYTWSSLSGTFNSTNEDIFNLNSDSYYLTIEDEIGCQESFGPYSIASPVPSIVIDEIIQKPSCFGFNDGQIITSVSGGTPNYTYNWSSNNPISGNGTNTISDLLSGEYELLITDNNNCQETITYDLPDQTPIVVTSSLSNYNGYNVRCFNGNDAWVASTVSGGIYPYQYEWKNQNNERIHEFLDIHDIGSGTYNLSVTDARGCEIISSFTITQPDRLTINITDYSHKSCTYNDDGFIEVETSGGVDSPVNSQNYLPHSFRWKASNSFHSTEKNIYDLTDNSYTLTIEDSNHCQQEITFVIEQPPFVIADYRTLNDTVTVHQPMINLYDNSEGNIIEWQWELSNGMIASTQDVMNLDLSSDLGSEGVRYFDLKLVVTDEYSCKDSTYGRLAIKEEHTLFVPNGFTPDQDGYNDSFKIFHHAMKAETYSISIFDRFGGIVFESNDPDMAWDGTHIRTGNELMTGSYSYIISYQDFEYREYDHTNCENCSGTITLVR